MKKILLFSFLILLIGIIPYASSLSYTSYDFGQQTDIESLCYRPTFDSPPPNQGPTPYLGSFEGISLNMTSLVEMDTSNNAYAGCNQGSNIYPIVQFKINIREDKDSIVELNWTIETSGNQPNDCDGTVCSVYFYAWNYTSGSWAFFGNNNGAAGGDGTFQNVTTAINDFVNVTDGQFNVVAHNAQTPYTLGIDFFNLSLTYNRAPIVTLVSPLNNSNYSSGTQINFTINMTDLDFNLQALELWGNWTIGWHKNQTNISVNNETASTTIFWLNLSDGRYVYNGIGNDTDGRNGTASNFTFTVDSTSPTIGFTGTNYTSLVPTTNITVNTTVRINATITDAIIGVSDVIIAENGTSNQWTNHSANISGNEYYFELDKSNLQNQENVSFYFIANDSLNNLRTSAMSSFKVENRIPTISTTNWNDTQYNNVADLNCSASGFADSDSDSPQYNFTFYSNRTAVAEPSTWAVNISFLITTPNKVLYKPNMSSNDYVRCGVKPYDNINYGSEVYSSSIQLGSSNLAPSISTQGTNASTGITNILSDSTNPTKNDTFIRFWTNITDDTGPHNMSVGKDSGFTSFWCQNLTSPYENMTYCDYTILGTDTSQVYDYFIRVTDSLVNSNTVQGTFEVNHPPKFSSLTNPSNNSWVNNATRTNLLFDWTSTDPDNDDVDYRFYLNSTVHSIDIINKTVTASQTHLNLSFDDITYYFKIGTFDAHGYNGSNSSLFQLRTDFTFPSVSAYTIQTTTDSLTGNTANWTVTDTYLNDTQCNYQVILTSNMVVQSESTLNCSLNGTTFTVPAFADYTFNLSSIDFAKNLQVSLKNFSVSESVGGGGGGGGGVTIINETQALIKLGGICDSNSDCETLLCDLTGTGTTKNTCVLTLCGNGFEDVGETNANCQVDTNILAKLAASPQLASFLKFVALPGIGIAFFILLVYGSREKIPKAKKTRLKISKFSLKKLFKGSKS